MKIDWIRRSAGSWSGYIGPTCVYRIAHYNDGTFILYREGPTADQPRWPFPSTSLGRFKSAHAAKQAAQKLPSENPMKKINWLVFASYRDGINRLRDRELRAAVGFKKPQGMTLSTRGVRTIYWSYTTKTAANYARLMLLKTGIHDVRVLPGRDLPNDEADRYLALTQNPLDPNTRILLIGSALVATSIGIATLFLAKKAAASTGGAALSLDPTDNNTTLPAKVGDTVTVSLPLNASTGYSWTAIDEGDTVLSSPPVTTKSATGESDTYRVTAAGTTSLTYQRLTQAGAQDTTTGSQIKFTITATAPANA